MPIVALSSRSKRRQRDRGSLPPRGGTGRAIGSNGASRAMSSGMTTVKCVPILARSRGSALASLGDSPDATGDLTHFGRDCSVRRARMAIEAVATKYRYH